MTEDGLGRAAIVRRADGFFCIYVHWKWSREVIAAVARVPHDYAYTWNDDKTPLELLYEGHEPKPGIYGTVEEARREIRSLPGFSNPVTMG